MTTSSPTRLATMQCLSDGVFSIASSQLRLSGSFCAAPPAVVGGDDRDALRVVDAIDDRIGREAAEDHRVRGTDARAREHRDRQFRNHRHVDRDAIAFFDAELAQAVRELADVVEQLFVGDGPAIARLAFVVVGDLVAVTALTWRSRQLTDTLSSPSANHFANGSFHSRILVNGFIHSSLRAQPAQNAR